LELGLELRVEVGALRRPVVDLRGGHGLEDFRAHLGWTWRKKPRMVSPHHIPPFAVSYTQFNLMFRYLTSF
ncbi:hypothetical protein DRJ58_03965, partial [Candidatus Acetothermia bacterium]